MDEAENLREGFRQRCDVALTIRSKTPDRHQWEPALIDVLEYVVMHERDHHDLFVAMMIELVDRPSFQTFPIVQFCMHKLRWPEVERAAKEVMARSVDSHPELWMRAILDAYSDSWTGRLYYDYYSDRSGPLSDNS